MVLGTLQRNASVWLSFEVVCCIYFALECLMILGWHRFFLKEGVVHAMEQLAATAPKEELKAESKDGAPKGRSPPLRRSSSRLKVCSLEGLLCVSFAAAVCLGDSLGRRRCPPYAHCALHCCCEDSTHDCC